MVASAVCAAVSPRPAPAAPPPAGGGATAPSYAQPAEGLLIIVADVQRHLADDVYRFPFPTDITGRNIFRASLVRLANYSKLYPGRLADIVALTEAQAWERLGGFREAGAAYERARTATKDDAVRRAAKEGYERVKKVSAVADLEPDRANLRTYERDLRKIVGDLGELAAGWRATPAESTALVARERNQMILAEFYVTMRFVDPFSTDQAEEELKRVLESNRDSKLRYAHHLRLGDFLFERAREYALRNDPEGGTFRMAELEAFTNRARAEYKLVEEADGFPEKLEGRAKLLALEAFVDRMDEKSR